MSKSVVKTGKSVNCQNCDMRFKGHYCPNCGQQFKEFQKPFKFLIFDLAANVISFDTRLLRSLRALFTRPGIYALDYVNGHRMRYVPPLRLYVFISFLFFLILSIFVSREVVLSEETKDSIQSELQINEITGNVGTVNIGEEIDAYKIKEILKIVKSVLDDPSRYINNFLKFVSWILFLLMPLYAFILWFFFRKSQPYFYSHLIFAVNQHAFLFFLSATILGIKLMFPDLSSHPENYAFWLIPAYMLIGKKQLYRKRWLPTFFRMFLAFFLYGMLFTLVLVLLFALWIDFKLF
jgi:hypothetical protein